MNDHTFYLAGSVPALTFAGDHLARQGCSVVSLPCPEVTHLVLPVPSFTPDGHLKGGGDLAQLLQQLPEDITVFGGNLDRAELERYQKVDFLQDASYLAENAAITAHCAVKVALARLPVTLQGCHVLVIGWGRIGKCLASLLMDMGAKVTVAARKETDRAMLRALGYNTEATDTLSYGLIRYRLIFNTVPFPVISEEKAALCGPECLKIDLASQPGIAGADVIWARGLPGTDAPETSGKLIARTCIRLAAGKE